MADIVENMAALQGALLVQHAPPALSDAFCATRLTGFLHHTYGAHRASLDIPAILTRTTAQ